MQGKKTFLALSTAFAALFVGCEWTGSSDSDSWSGSYDAMNFSGTYRAVTTATQLQTTTTTTDSDNQNSNEFITFSNESGGSFAKDMKSAAGQTDNPNVVPSSFQVEAKHGSTVYVWNDNGSGSLVFGGVSGSTGGNSSANTPVANEQHGSTSSETTYSFKLSNANVVAGSVTVRLGLKPDDTTTAFSDNGDGTLKTHNFSGGGSVNYTTGAIILTFNAKPTIIGKGGLNIYVDYTSSSSEVTTSNFSGGGAIQYTSGAWSLTLSPEMPETATITLRYSAYTENSGSVKTTSITTTKGNEVSSLTVSQSGQNLTITLNNGIVMSGKFTNVQQTGKINEDTNEGYNTYNAQFQVQTTDNKLVGSLNYDLSNGFRMMNGTWTWGKSSYDVQAVGPSWKNSADTSTLSVGSITK